MGMRAGAAVEGNTGPLESWAEAGPGVPDPRRGEPTAPLGGSKRDSDAPRYRLPARRAAVVWPIVSSAQRHAARLPLGELRLVSPAPSRLRYGLSSYVGADVALEFSEARCARCPVRFCFQWGPPSLLPPAARSRGVPPGVGYYGRVHPLHSLDLSGGWRFWASACPSPPLLSVFEPITLRDRMCSRSIANSTGRESDKRACQVGELGGRRRYRRSVNGSYPLMPVVAWKNRPSRLRVHCS